MVRLDRDAPGNATGAYVRGDAACLPFADGAFSAVIANHSLEHFDHLDRALHEIGRVLRPNGSLYIAVPDASTWSDKLYRWLASGGGHVNPFTSPEQVIDAVVSRTGLEHRATRLLCSSLSMLRGRPRPLRLWLLGGGTDWSLQLYNWLSRRLDRHFGTRWSVYGWAFWFGNIGQPISVESYRNVCLGCGSAFPATELTAPWKCRLCGIGNPYSPDF